MRINVSPGPFPEPRFLSAAIDKGIRSGRGEGGPFGAVIVKDGRVLTAAHNTVLTDNDPTRHAEIAAISAVARSLGTYDLSGCTIYSTTEPCPMCFAAIHWARIGKLVYGTTIEDVKKLGFNELTIPVSVMKEKGNSSVEIYPGFMKRECEELLKYWKNLPNKTVY